VAEKKSQEAPKVSWSDLGSRKFQIRSVPRRSGRWYLVSIIGLIISSAPAFISVSRALSEGQQDGGISPSGMFAFVFGVLGLITGIVMSFQTSAIVEITMDGMALQIRRRLLGIGLTRTYLHNRITNLRPFHMKEWMPRPSSPAAKPHKGPAPEYGIVFDHRGGTRWLINRMTYIQAQELTREIVRRYPPLGTTGT